MKKVIFLILLLLFAGIGGYFLFLDHQEGFDITVENQTDEKISDLYITYNSITSEIEIPPIHSGGKYKFNVTPTEEFGENSMTLHYKDNEGQLHTEYVFGYFEEGYYGNAKITLKSIDENGKIQIKVVEDMFN
jgi:hypothetical protein